MGSTCSEPCSNKSLASMAFWSSTFEKASLPANFSLVSSAGAYGEDAQVVEESTAKSQEPYDPASGMFSAHDETQSEAFDMGSTTSQDRRLDNLSNQQSSQLADSQTRDSAGFQSAELLGSSEQVSSSQSLLCVGKQGVKVLRCCHS